MFKSRNAAITHIQSELSRIGECDSLRGTDEKFCDLMIAIAHVREKFDGENIIDIKLVANHAAFAVLENGHVEDFSWRKAILGEKCADDHLTKAMRWAIRPQIVEFTENHVQRGCALCGSTDNVQVDHFTPFAVLKRDFLAQQKKVPAQFVDQGKGQLEFLEIDSEFRDTWCDYHRKHAMLRLLCGVHNVSKCH